MPLKGLNACHSLGGKYVNVFAFEHAEFNLAGHGQGKLHCCVSNEELLYRAYRDGTPGNVWQLHLTASTSLIA